VLLCATKDDQVVEHQPMLTRKALLRSKLPELYAQLTPEETEHNSEAFLREIQRIFRLLSEAGAYNSGNFSQENL